MGDGTTPFRLYERYFKRFYYNFFVFVHEDRHGY